MADELLFTRNMFGQLMSGLYAPRSVVEEMYATGSVSARALATGAVTSTKILDGTIATADIADNAVTSAKIAALTIVGGDIAAVTVTRDKLASEAWTTFSSVVITQSNTPTRTINYCAYRQSARDVIYQGNVTFTSNGTGLNPILVSLPVNAAGAGYRVIGFGALYTGSKYFCLAELNNNATHIRFQYTSGTADATLGANSPMAAAVVNTNALTWAVVYEATT